MKHDLIGQSKRIFWSVILGLFKLVLIIIVVIAFMPPARSGFQCNRTIAE